MGINVIIIRSLQESKSETDSPPLNDNLQRINPNPKLVQRSLLDLEMYQSESSEVELDMIVGDLGKNIFKERKEKVEVNLNELQKIQGLYTDDILPELLKVDNIDASDIEKLNNLMKELNNIKNPNLDSLKKITQDFGYLNENFLNSKLAEAGEGELLNDLEKQIYRLYLDQIDPKLSSFYPSDPSLKYPLTSNNKANTKAIKSLINIIYKYEEDIAIAASALKASGNDDLGLLLVEGENKLNPSNEYEDTIATPNLAKLLDKHRNEMYRLLNNIETRKFRLKPLSDIKKFISNSPFFNSIRHIQELMLLTLDQFAFNDMVENTIDIYSKYSNDVYTGTDISNKLGKNDNYLADRNLRKNVKQLSTYLRLLIAVYLGNPNNFNLINNDDYENIKKEMLDEVFSSMVRRGAIKSKDFKLDFEAIFFSMLLLTNTKTQDVRQGMYPLSKFAEDMGHSVNLFKEKFLYLSYINNELANDMLQGIDIPGGDVELHKLASDKLNEIKKRNGKGSEGDYNRFWSQLYPIQVMEFLKITLGLDIWGLKFIKDAEKGKKIFEIDIERHHLEKDKSLYTIFRFSEDYLDDPKKFTNDQPPIAFKDFLPTLAPLMLNHHRNLGSRFASDTETAMNRLMHLYELIQRSLSKGILLNEFKTKTAVIDGKEVLLWEGLDDTQIKKWIKRWQFAKDEGFEAFVLDEEYGYPQFYKNRYKPMEDDFRLFLNDGHSVHRGLFSNKEGKRNRFWEWFLSTYLRENIYPIIK